MAGRIIEVLGLLNNCFKKINTNLASRRLLVLYSMSKYKGQLEYKKYYRVANALLDVDSSTLYELVPSESEEILDIDWPFQCTYSQCSESWAKSAHQALGIKLMSS